MEFLVPGRPGQDTPQSDEVPEERPHFQAHDPTGLQEAKVWFTPL